MKDSIPPRPSAPRSGDDEPKDCPYDHPIDRGIHSMEADGWRYVVCGDCLAQGPCVPNRWTDQDAIDAANRRRSPAPADEAKDTHTPPYRNRCKNEKHSETCGWATFGMGQWATCDGQHGMVD